MIDFSRDNPPTTSDERIKALLSMARIERELGYVDERVANTELPAGRFDGERYEAEVPDTLDLTDNAVLAINAYTRMLDPAMDYRTSGGALQLWEEETDALERTLGSWAGWARPNDARPRSLMQCCAGNAGRSMYYVWDSIVTREGDEVRVNLHLNRASPWLDVESHLPYEGKVVLRVKDAPRAAVRLPEWTNRDRVTCRVNGVSRALAGDGNYIQVRDLRRGDEVVLEFPMREQTLFREIAGVPYRLTIRGNTVVDIDPQGKIYPLYQRGHYQRDRAPLRKVTRFVPEDKIEW